MSGARVNKGTFAEQYKKRMVTKKRMEDAWETRRAKEPESKRGKNIRLDEKNVRGKKSNGSVHIDGERRKAQRHPNRGSLEASSLRDSTVEARGRAEGGQTAEGISADRRYQEAGSVIPAVLIASLAAILLLSGCAFEAIAVLRTEDAVKGKLSISKEQIDDPNAPREPTFLDRILPVQ